MCSLHYIVSQSAKKLSQHKAPKKRQKPDASKSLRSFALQVREGLFLPRADRFSFLLNKLSVRTKHLGYYAPQD